MESASYESLAAGAQTELVLGMPAAFLCLCLCFFPFNPSCLRPIPSTHRFCSVLSFSRFILSPLHLLSLATNLTQTLPSHPLTAFPSPASPHLRSSSLPPLPTISSSIIAIPFFLSLRHSQFIRHGPLSRHLPPATLLSPPPPPPSSPPFRLVSLKHRHARALSPEWGGGDAGHQLVRLLHRRRYHEGAELEAGLARATTEREEGGREGRREGGREGGRDGGRE